MKKCHTVSTIVMLLLFLCIATGCATYPEDAVRSFGELPFTNHSEIKCDDDVRLYMTIIGDTHKKFGISLYISAAPFTEAGLSYEWRYYNVIDENLGGFGYSFWYKGGDFSPADVLKDFIKQNKECLTYNSDEARYRITFTLGAFEWAEDITATNQDIVFIVFGSTMIKNGVNPDAVEGWEYDVENNCFVKSFDIG